MSRDLSELLRPTATDCRPLPRRAQIGSLQADVASFCIQHRYVHICLWGTDYDACSIKMYYFYHHVCGVHSVCIKHRNPRAAFAGKVSTNETGVFISACMILKVAIRGHGTKSDRDRERMKICVGYEKVRGG